MKPKAGYDYLATAAHFAAESSTGTNVNVCTTDDFTKSVDALVRPKHVIQITDHSKQQQTTTKQQANHNKP
jgi:ribulose 1,5-bisphosphate carboxylase large subunit-like protein